MGYKIITVLENEYFPLRDDLNLKLPCGCSASSEYLPKRGGDRMIKCKHDIKYVISGVVKHRIDLTITRWEDPEPNDSTS